MIFVTSSIKIIGFHYWKDAPDHLSFLCAKHRHVFKITATAEVSHSDREKEFFEFADTLKSILSDLGVNEKLGFNFGGLSCEHIAQYVIDRLPYVCSCSVFEDGENGSTVTKDGYNVLVYSD